MAADLELLCSLLGGHQAGDTTLSVEFLLRTLQPVAVSVERAATNVLRFKDRAGRACVMLAANARECWQLSRLDRQMDHTVVFTAMRNDDATWAALCVALVWVLQGDGLLAGSASRASPAVRLLSGLRRRETEAAVEHDVLVEDGQLRRKLTIRRDAPDAGSVQPRE